MGKSAHLEGKKDVILCVWGRESMRDNQSQQQQRRNPNIFLIISCGIIRIYRKAEELGVTVSRDWVKF